VGRKKRIHTFILLAYAHTIKEEEEHTHRATPLVIRTRRAFYYYRHRAIIYDGHLHHCSEDTRQHPVRTQPLSQAGHEMLIERLRLFWSGGKHKTRAVPFLRIGIERELGYHEDATASILQADVHLPLSVFEHTQPCALIREKFGIRLCIPVPDAQENNKAFADARMFGRADCQPTTRYPLNDYTHEMVSF
jgi:hypothetical protein